MSNDNKFGRNAQALIEIVDHFGVYGLAGADGCRCAHFSLWSIDIDIHCHKSNGGIDWHRWGVIRVSNRTEDVNMVDRAAIAEKLLSVLHEPEWDSDDDPYWLVRFCDWKHDNEQTCIYCGKHREDKQGYLCEKCLVAHSPYGPQYKIADQYDFRRVEIRYPVSTEIEECP